MSINNIKKSRGRPKVESAAVLVRIPTAVLNGLDAYAEKSEEAIGRPEAIRRILTDYLSRRGLIAKGKR